MNDAEKKRLTINHLLLTGLGVQTRGIPIIEEVVETGAICEDVGAINDAETPGPGAIRLCAFREGRVGVRRLYCVRRQGVRIALEISRFMLNEAHEDVAGVRDLVVVEDVVFG